ncbi:MAG: DUF4382 domain-containing protein [Sinobacteraceae bacterium]|nr:DUF4382 domain-containing protein [Nevskiaceae bacterium]
MIASLLIAIVGAALVGCTPKTTVSTTGNVPAAYNHVFLTIQGVWFNTSATAGPDDAGWIKYPLTTPVTVDLANSMGGTVSAITTGLGVPIGIYSQIRLIPVDAGTTTVASATANNALYNDEVDYTDSAGNLHQVRLELENPEKGIGISTPVQVKGAGTNVLSSSSSSSSNCTASSSSSSSSGCSKPFLIAANLDGSTDVVPFIYNGTLNTVGSTVITGGVTGILLNPHMTAYDVSLTGAIQGTLDLTNVNSAVGGQSNSSLADIQVTAELLSTDGTRHVTVNSAPVSTGGTFTLYPLATTAASPTRYDLVIHGPAIETIIIKDVAVNAGDPTATTPVNIGTLTPLAAASSFKFNLNTTTPLSAGALVGFYQTINAANEVPYLIMQMPVDPFTRGFDVDVSAPTSQIQYGTFSSSGATITLTTADPAEGGSSYRLAANAPMFTEGTFTNPVLGTAAATTSVAVPTLVPQSGFTSPATIVNVNQTNTFDRGDLIISHDGAIVQTVVLDTALQKTGTTALAIPGLPIGGGTTSTSGTTVTPALYYVSVRVWNSANPTTTLTRETFPNPLDLRNLSSVAYSLTIQ